MFSHAHHSPRVALIAGVAAFAVAVAILVLAPPLHSASAVGAAFVALFAIKHLALVATVSLPSVAAVRRLRRKRTEVPGYVRTGDAEPHRGVLRLEHHVRVVPSERSRRAMIELDADKRMTLTLLSKRSGDEVREGLRERYAKRGVAGADVDRLLAPIGGTLARGTAIVIAYDAAARTTRLTVGDTTTEVAGTGFMRATWRLWFDEAVPAALADALIASSPSP